MDGWSTTITRFEHVARPDTARRQGPLSWSDIVEWWQSPRAMPKGGKSSLDGWSAAVFTEVGRGGDIVESVGGLVLDADAYLDRDHCHAGEPSADPLVLRRVLCATFPGAAWAAHTTPSSTLDCWRWRVFLPLSRPVTAPDHALAVQGVRALLMRSECPALVEADTASSMDPSRFWFRPAAGGDYEAISQLGAPIDPESLFPFAADALDLRAKLWPETASKPPVPVDLSHIPEPTTSTERYGRKVLESACGRIAGASEGERHSTIVAQARTVGGYIVSCGIPEDLAREELLHFAVDAVGEKRRKEAERAVRDGIEYGKASPLVPAPMDPQRHQKRESTPPPTEWDETELEDGDGSGVGVPLPVDRSALFDRGDEVELGQDLCWRIGGTDATVYDEDSVWTSVPGPAWTRVDKIELRRLAQDYAGMFKRAGKDKDGEDKVAPIRLSSAQCKGVATACAVRVYRSGFFSDAPIGAAFRGSFARVDDDRVVVEDLTPDHRVRSDHVSEYELPLRGAKALATMSLLRETWAGCSDLEDRIEYLFEWLGLALVGMSTRFKDSPLLVGLKDTGKSRVLDMITNCFPPSSRRAVALHAMSHPYDRAHLSGGRINTVAELPSRDLLDGESAKAILSGDPVSARQPRGEVFMWRPRCAHVFAANELPPSLDRALMGRFVLLNCPNVVPAARQDRNLIEKLAAETPAVARLALDALPAVLRRGQLLRPGTSESLSTQWASLGDSVAGWASENVRSPVADQSTGSMELYRHYRSWCGDHGHRPVASPKWKARLEDYGFAPRRTNRGVTWAAVLLTTAEQEAEDRWGMYDR